MISYSIYTTPEDNYLSIMIGDDKRLISATSFSLRVMIIDKTEVKDTRYIDVSPERLNKLVQKTIRKILCMIS